MDDRRRMGKVVMKDEQGEGIKDPIPEEMAQHIQQLESKSTVAEMMENLQEDKEPLPWLPETGTTFTLDFDEGPREYKVTYVNRGKYRFSAEPTDKSYMK